MILVHEFSDGSPLDFSCKYILVNDLIKVALLHLSASCIAVN